MWHCDATKSSAATGERSLSFRPYHIDHLPRTVTATEMHIVQGKVAKLWRRRKMWITLRRYRRSIPSVRNVSWRHTLINTRTGEGSENHTVWRGGGAYNAPHRSQLLWELPRRILGVSRAALEHFLAKILGPWVNPFKVKKGRPFWQKRMMVFRFFRASSVAIIAMKNLKKSIRKLLKRFFANLPSDFG